jgi:L-threonylcarbamoyladenylate synthase
VAETGNDLIKAGKLLLAGELVAIPTETVYGLAANALNERAVLKIYEAKERPFFDPLIIHVHSIDAAKQHSELNDKRLALLAENFWPGPLTLLLPKKKHIPDLVTSGLPRVAVRIPQHPLTLKLLASINVPLAAPSANPFGYISPTEPAHVQKQLGTKVSYILDGGASNVGLESTIVGIENNDLCVYRLGGLPVSDIEKISGKVKMMLNNSGDPKSPGQLTSHYAPSKKLLLGEINKLLASTSKKASVICFGKSDFPAALHIYNLSATGDLSEAAVNLFKFLRLADEDDSEIVIAEELPAHGLGAAINDRLSRAATK